MLFHLQINISHLKGIRYNDIYMVREHELYNAETAMHRFTLIRIEGQEPVWYTGVEQCSTYFEAEGDAYA